MQLPSSLTQSLGAGLARRRQQRQVFELSAPANEQGLRDFGSNDSLGLRTNPSVRKLFLRELGAHEDFDLGAGASRVLGGSTDFVTRLERELADFHGAEDALFYNSGYEANVALYGNLPGHGDAIVHDSFIHASIHDGMRAARASIVKKFAHNDVHDLARTLADICAESDDIRNGRKTVFLATESFYSMDGDMAPVKEILDTAKQVLPHQNFIIIIDEAHSAGLIGPGGSGYIRHLGLEKECIIQMQSYAKAPGAMGAVILCSSMIKEFLANYSRSLIFSTGPSFPTVAMIRASVNTLRSPEGDELRRTLQANMKLFYELVRSHPKWKAVESYGVMRIPTATYQHPDRFHIPLVPLITAEGLCHDLRSWLRERGFDTYAVRYPIVPRDEERVRIILRSSLSADDIRDFVESLIVWAENNKGGKPGL